MNKKYIFTIILILFIVLVSMDEIALVNGKKKFYKKFLKKKYLKKFLPFPLPMPIKKYKVHSRYTIHQHNHYYSMPFYKHHNHWAIVPYWLLKASLIGKALGGTKKVIIAFPVPFPVHDETLAHWHGIVETLLRF